MRSDAGRRRAAAPLAIVALVAARDGEEDVIAETIGALAAAEVQVYLLDASGTGASAAAAEVAAQGVIGIERLPPADPSEVDDAAAHERVLARMEELARTIDADWFLRGDADEIIESAWIDLPLRDSIALVDTLGYNAIACRVFHFLPTSADLGVVENLQSRLHYYDPTLAGDVIPCWKKTDQPVALVESLGREVQFADRRIWPVPFPLRHYPFRRNRPIPPDEAPARAAGWHVYDGGLGAGVTFVRDPAALARFDAEATRVALWLQHRGVERLERVMAATADEADRLTDERPHLLAQIQSLEAQLAERCAQLTGECDSLRTRLAEQERILAQVLGSRSWKLTTPLRAAERLLRGR